MKITAISTITILILSYTLTSTASVKLSQSEQNKYRTLIQTNCENIKTEPNKKQICSCIATNHLLQIQFAKNKSEAFGQLQWISDFYVKTNGKHKIDQEEFERDPYSIADGVLFSFDDECKSDPKYIVTFAE